MQSPKRKSNSKLQQGESQDHRASRPINYLNRASHPRLGPLADASISKQARSNKDSPSSALSASRTKLSQNINSQTRSKQRKSPNPSTEPQGSHCRKHRHHSSTLSIHPPLPFGGINASMKTPTCAPANTRTRPRCPSKTRQNARRPGRRIYCCFHE